MNSEELQDQIGTRDHLDRGHPASDHQPPRTFLEVLALVEYDAVMLGDGWLQVTRNADGTLTFLRGDPARIRAGYEAVAREADR